MKTLCITITHVITTLLIQATILALAIWHYDIRAKERLIYTTICIVLVFADYIISVRLLRKESVISHKLLLHFIDLVLTGPGLLLAGNEVISKGVNTPKTFLYVVIIMLILDAVLVIERVMLVKK